MADSKKKSLEDVGLPVKLLPVPSVIFPIMITATTDNLPAYFESERVEGIPIPQGWEMHYEIIMQIRQEGLWECVSDILSAAIKLIGDGAEFATSWNKLVEEYLRIRSSNENEVELEFKEGTAIMEWNERMASLRRSVEKSWIGFAEKVKGKKVESRIKRCFGVHRNLGIDGDGEHWWERTVGLLQEQAEEWMAAPLTVEMWLRDLALVIEQEKKIHEVRLFADTLCASFEQGQGMIRRNEMIYLVKDGVVSKKGKMCWVSTELGHVTNL